MPFLLSFDIPLDCEERLESIEHCNLEVGKGFFKLIRHMARSSNWTKHG